MYDVIKKYVDNENSNGLLLIDMPTGSGKTFSAIKYIYDSCLDDKNGNRKYIFVTTLKKNLPVEDIKKHFENDNSVELFKEKVLLIDSNMDSVISGWSSDVEYSIPADIKRLQEYKDFKSNLEFVKTQREHYNSSLKEFLPSIETNLREKTEPIFRRKISDLLGKTYPTVEKRIYAIKTDKKWQWLGKLYPAVFTRERQVLFMSMDKFLSRNTTIVEPSYMFYNSDLLNNAVVFIDEFDATKDTVLKNLINNGLRDSVNYIDLFKDIYASLHTDEFPAVLTIPSKERMKGKYRNQTLESVVEGIKDKADYIFSEYTLQFKHRTFGETEESYQNYLFQDHQFHSILDGNNSYIGMYSDEKNRLNSIQFTNKRPDLEKNNIQSMLGQLRGFVKFFQGAINILAINYRQCKEEQRKDGEDIFSMEPAIRSVLSLFRLSDESIDYLTTQIMMSSHKIKGDIESADYDLSFYENGFRYYAFENDIAHDMQSQIMMYSFQTTPEKILLRYCEKAKVIGISATATVPSVIGNYDIDYLRNKMNRVFCSVSSEDRNRLNLDFERSVSGYNHVSIHADLLGSKGNYNKESWRQVFKEDELVNAAYELINRTFEEGEDKNNYLKERYLRVSLAFKKFVIHDDIQSFLCVLNKHPRKGDNQLDKDKLFQLFKYIAKDNGWERYNNRVVLFLDGAEYDDKKNDMINRLASGEKLFVISVYQTIGAGQNLQYPIPDSFRNSIVRINDRNTRDEKDFDAIYLDKPTNVIVPMVDKLEEPDFVKYLFQMEFLQERAEISSAETKTNIRNAFKTYMTGHKTNGTFANVYYKQSVVQLSTRYIIQAIGRICRTNSKNKNIYIYADEHITESVDTSVINNRIFNHEFIELIDCIKRFGEKTPETISYENLASLKSVRVNKEIKNMLNNDWTEAKIDKWKKLRNLVLKCPTASEDEAKENFIIKNFYAQLPKADSILYYHQEEDYNKVEVSFNKTISINSCLSAEDSNLQNVLKIEGIKELFEKNGWATTFERNNYIMTPPLWNNIYKGAIGEVVGKYLFETLLNVTVKEIDALDLFELFDFQIEGTSVYVDFKNWHEGQTEDKTKIIKHISTKAQKCGCKCVIIANIYAERLYKPTETDMNGIHILSIPNLVSEYNGQVVPMNEPWMMIKRCIDEYRNTDK